MAGLGVSLKSKGLFIALRVSSVIAVVLIKCWWDKENTHDEKDIHEERKALNNLILFTKGEISLKDIKNYGAGIKRTHREIYNKVENCLKQIVYHKNLGASLSQPIQRMHSVFQFESYYLKALTGLYDVLDGRTSTLWKRVLRRLRNIVN